MPAATPYSSSWQKVLCDALVLIAVYLIRQAADVAIILLPSGGVPADHSTIYYRQKPRPAATLNSLWRESVAETMMAHTTQNPTARPTTRATQVGLLLVSCLGGAAICTAVSLSGITSSWNGFAGRSQLGGSKPPTTFESEPPRLTVFVPAPPAPRAPLSAPVQWRSADPLPAGYRWLDAGDPASPLVPVTPVASARAMPPPISRPDYPATQVPASTPVDYAARDRRIESLKQQIDALDDQIRTIRNNPRGCPYWYHYYGSGNGGVNQPALQKYLDQLDQQRTTLRREKWQLEGR